MGLITYMKLSLNHWQHKADIVVISAATFALHYAIAQKSGILVSGGLQDTDAYMRLIRIEELWQSGDWYQTLTSSLGAPGKLSLHWTRPLDILILLPALLFHIFGLPIERAIYWVGFWISPIFQLLACIVAAKAAKLLWPEHKAWRLAALMVLFNGAAFTYCMAGRPDHHSLGLLLTLLTAHQIIHATLKPGKSRAAWIAGIWAGAGIWVSPEALISSSAIIMSLGLLWLLNTNEARIRAQIGRQFCAGMTAILAGAILLEQPLNALLRVEYDKVSVLHLALATTATFNFALAERMTWQGAKRILFMCSIVFASITIIAFVFPGFYMGPLGNISNKEAMVFLNDILEMSAIWPTNRDTTNQFFGMIGNALAALPIIPICLYAWRQHEKFAPTLILSIAYLIALLGALQHQRLAIFLSAFGAILGCGLFSLICNLAENRLPATQLATRLFGALLVVFGGQLWLLAPAEKIPLKSVCDPKPIAEWLNSTRPGISPRDTVSTIRQTPIISTESINYTPELAYRTPYRFIGGPYHRGVNDVADMYKLVLSTNDDDAKSMLIKRQIDYLLICITEVPKVIGESAQNSLYHRLLRQDVPNWLQPLKMSEAASKEFRLFSVKLY